MKAERLEVMMNIMTDMNEMEFRDEKEVSPKALASVNKKLIGASIPVIPNVNPHDIARAFFKEIKADIGVFSSEAWLLDASDKIEVVITIGGYDGETVTHMSKIIRKDSGIAYLEEYINMDRSEKVVSRCFEGVFTNEIDTIGEPIGRA